MFNYFRGSQLNFIVLQQSQQRYHGDLNAETPQLQTWWKYWRAGSLSTTPAIPIVYLASNLAVKTVIRSQVAKAIDIRQPLPVSSSKGNTIVVMEEEREFQKRALTTSVISGVSAAITHPLAIINNWQITQDIPRTMLETYKQVKVDQKDFADGLFLDATLTFGSEYLNILVTRRLNAEVRQRLPSLSQQQQQQEQTEPRTKTLKFVNEFMIQTWVQSMSFVFVRALLYPLYTARYHLEAQGASVYNPIRYRSTLEVFQSIWKEEGLKGFYKGFTSLGAVLSFDQISLFLANLLINFLLERMPEDELQRFDQYLKL